MTKRLRVGGDATLRGYGDHTFEEVPQLQSLASSAVRGVAVNRSYSIVLLADGKLLEFGAGLCGERDSSPVTYDGSTSSISSDDHGSGATASSSLLLAPPLSQHSVVGACAVQILSVACGGGHVVAIAEASSHHGVLTWGASWPTKPVPAGMRTSTTGADASDSSSSSSSSSSLSSLSSSSITPAQRQVLGLGGCRAACCFWCARYRPSTGESHDALEEEADLEAADSAVGGGGWRWVAGLPRSARPLSVSAGDSYSAVLLSDGGNASSSEGSSGHIWTWGIGPSGQLGLGGSGATRTLFASCRAMKVNLPLTDDDDNDNGHNDNNDEKQTDDGVGNGNGKGKGNDKSAPVCSVALGPSHAAAVDGRGRLFTWGSGARGQLGHGDALDAWRPRLVRHLLGVPILALRQSNAANTPATMAANTTATMATTTTADAAAGVGGVACGLWHTAAASADGALYTWGSGDFGQLGDRAPSSLSSSSSSSTSSAGGIGGGGASGLVAKNYLRTTPQLVKEIDADVLGVVAGSRHTVAVVADDCGGVSSSASSSSSSRRRLLVLGQIGISGDSSSSHSRREIEALEDPVVALASGPWSLLVATAGAATSLEKRPKAEAAAAITTIQGAATACQTATTTADGSGSRRLLLTPLASAEGQELLRRLPSPAHQRHDRFWRHWRHQEGRTHCSVASVAVLASVAAGRHVSEGELLGSHVAVRSAAPRVSEHGATLKELGNMVAAAPGLACSGSSPHHASSSSSSSSSSRESAADMARRVASALAKGSGALANYDMAALGQEGAGHVSPISAVLSDEGGGHLGGPAGAHHGADSMILVLDVWPETEPFWVPAGALFAAMATVDPDSQLTRGYVLVDPHPRPAGGSIKLQVPRL